MKTLACVEWVEATQTCASQAWVDLPSAIPPLSVGDALEISAAIGALWATAYTLRLVARFIWRG